MDASISPTCVRYMISRTKELNDKNKERKRIQGGDIIKILRKRTYRKNG